MRRVYCPAVRAELHSVLAERPPADRAFFDLFEAVNAFEQVALTWCPTLAGAPAPALWPTPAHLCRPWRMASSCSMQPASAP